MWHCHQILCLKPVALLLYPKFAMGSFTVYFCVLVSPSVKWDINALINVGHLIQSLTASSQYKHLLLLLLLITILFL